MSQMDEAVARYNKLLESGSYRDLSWAERSEAGRGGQETRVQTCALPIYLIRRTGFQVKKCPRWPRQSPDTTSFWRVALIAIFRGPRDRKRVGVGKRLEFRRVLFRST